MKFGKQTPEDKARDELDELDREEFVLRKNMMHDKHRLAYIIARRRQLKADHPATVQPLKAPAVVRWLGRAAPPTLTEEVGTDPLLPWLKGAKS